MGRGGSGGGRGGGKEHSPKDMRSMAMNPNNPAHGDSQDNRSNQLNPNNSAYESSRAEASGDKSKAERSDD